MNHINTRERLDMPSFTHPITHTPPVVRQQQAGASLIVSLMLLIVLTLLGLSGMQSTIMQERMANNVRDKGMAFQAAESAIRSGEDWVKTINVSTLANPQDGATCAPPCNIIDLNDYASMTTENIDWWKINARAFSNMPSGTFAAAPRFIVERHSKIEYSLDPSDETLEPHLYRITAIGVGGTATAQAIIETLYSRND